MGWRNSFANNANNADKGIILKSEEKNIKKGLKTTFTHPSHKSQYSQNSEKKNRLVKKPCCTDSAKIENEKKMAEEYSQNPAIFSKTNIEKMIVCIHGRPCKFLDSEPPDRPICCRAGYPVFDLDRCLNDYWRK